MSKSIDMDALTIQKFLENQPDVLVYAIASLKFPTPSPVRKFGVMHEELSAKSEDVVKIINDKFSDHAFGLFLDDIVRKIVLDQNPTQSGVASIILTIFTDNTHGLLQYMLDAELNAAEISYVEATAKEAFKLMQQIVRAKQKSGEEDSQDFLKFLESRDDADAKPRARRLKDLSDEEIGDMIGSLDDELSQEGNGKLLKQWEDKKKQIIDDYDKKKGTNMKKGSIDSKIEGIARQFTVSTIKKLYTEASRYIVIKHPEPKTSG